MTRKLLEELESSQNGSFELLEEQGKAVLKIFNPQGDGRPVHPTDLMNRLRSMQIVVDKGVALDRLIKQTQEGKLAEGAAHVLGDWPKIAERRDATVEVQVSSDHTSAQVFVDPPEGGGKRLTLENLKFLLKDHGIIKGIDESVLKEVVEKPIYKRLVKVAEGKPPVRGENGYVRPLFETMVKPKQSVKEKKIDYKEVNLIKSAKAGEVIAELVDATKGTPGYSVAAQILQPEPGIPAKFNTGANVEISADGKKLLSKIEGRPVMESSGRIRVDEVIYLKNVDYSTGNVDFPGSVIVEDSVADGFKLHASGSIILQSSVGVCDISAGKDIILSAGFMGRGEGKIVSEGDVYARFVEQGTIIAKGSIFISEASLHSRLVAGNSITVKGGRGDITGGDASAGNFVHCTKLGGAGETKTTITVGIDPALRDTIEEIKNALKAKQETLEKIRISLNRVNEVLKKRALDATETQTREKLLLALKKYRSLVESDEMQLESAQHSYVAHDKAYVLVEAQLFPNVEVNFGKGALFRSGIRPVNGKQAIYVNEDRLATAASSLPSYMEKPD